MLFMINSIFFYINFFIIIYKADEMYACHLTHISVRYDAQRLANLKTLQNPPNQIFVVSRIFNVNIVAGPDPARTNLATATGTRFINERNFFFIC